MCFSFCKKIYNHFFVKNISDIGNYNSLDSYDSFDSFDSFDYSYTDIFNYDYLYNKENKVYDV
jgi:hypothetical protein